MDQIRPKSGENGPVAIAQFCSQRNPISKEAQKVSLYKCINKQNDPKKSHLLEQKLVAAALFVALLSHEEVLLLRLAPVPSPAWSYSRSSWRKKATQLRPQIDGN